ncbi:MAG: hypothetical protein GF398_01645 [Chitinivibrionales bacterium]|nr:hypothetical protein [Chitinivibrionales bacterium]
MIIVYINYSYCYQKIIKERNHKTMSKENLTLNEIYQTSVNIERNASEFYKKAADNASDEEVKTLFIKLSRMEDDHAKTFSEMRGQLKDEEGRENVFDRGDEMSALLVYGKDLYGWEGKAGPDKPLTGKEDRLDLLKSALEAEKNTVIFYTMIKQYSSSQSRKNDIDNIILEEMRHIAAIEDTISNN